MPNGLSGGFSVSKQTLEPILNALPADTVIGMTLTRPFASINASTVCRMVSAYPDDLIWVEEHDYSSYVIHLEPANTYPPDAEKWIVVYPESPVFEELRRQHVRAGRWGTTGE